MHRLFQPITSLKYVAQKRAKLYAKLDITTPYDLLYHLPRHYMDYRNPLSIAEAQNQTLAVLRVQILQKLAPQFIRSGLTVFKAIAADDTAQISIVLYNNHFPWIPSPLEAPTIYMEKSAETYSAKKSTPPTSSQPPAIN